MIKAKDTLIRQLTLLRLIPRAPQCIATTTLQKKLDEQGFNVSLRTIQRNLEALSTPFALQCDDSRSPYRWSFMRNAPIDLPAMDTPTALALSMAKTHLNKLLPQSVLDLLTPQLKRACQHLDNLSRNDLAHWSRRVRALPNGKTLQPASVSTEVWRYVSTALLERKQLQIDYLSRSKSEVKSMLIHPVGLVSRHSVSYLLGTVNNYSDIRQFALHRIKQIDCLDASANEQTDFDIDSYIQSGGFNAPQPVKEVELVADISPQIAWILNETPLSQEQSLEPLENSNWQRLRARVPKDQETLWWIFSLGENVFLHKPQSWNLIIKTKLSSMTNLYATQSTLENTCENAP